MIIKMSSPPRKLLYCVFSLICCYGTMVADVGVLARALNPNGLLGKGRIYFYDRIVCDKKKWIPIFRTFLIRRWPFIGTLNDQ